MPGEVCEVDWEVCIKIAQNMDLFKKFLFVVKNSIKITLEGEKSIQILRSRE